MVTRPVRLLHLTDPHLLGDESLEIYDVNTALSLRRVLRQAGAEPAPPDAILVTGDVADDRSARAYDHFRNQLRGLGTPVLCLPGNHDTPSLMASMLNADGFRYCGRSTFGGWTVVMLDSHLPSEPSGLVSTPELERLEVELRASAGSHVLVCLHHPPLPVGSAWLDAVGLSNGAELLAVIDRHPQVRVVLAGHVHQASDVERGAARFLTTPSTCAQFTPHTENCVMDLRPPGYRWLNLLPDGSIRTEVRWLEDWTVTARPTDSRARFMS
jgi:Icc protein